MQNPDPEPIAEVSVTPRRRRWRIWLPVGVVVVGLGVYYGPTIFDLLPIVRAYIEKPAERSYAASRQGNLEEIAKALALFHENEGQFPDAANWMDGLKITIRTSDMPEAEALKKLENPDPDAGYAMNEEASNKFKGDLDPKTPVIFESKSRQWNGHGPVEANSMKGGLAIFANGSVGPLP